MADNKSKSEDLKKRGNEALGEGNTAEAIQLYSQAIEVAPDNHVLYSNRCAAYMKAEEYEKALADAQETVRLKKDWPKGYSRQAAALIQLDRLGDARKVCEEGLQVDPNNQQIKKCLEDIRAKSKEMNNPFTDPVARQRLRDNPKTRAYLEQPDFMAKLDMLAQNPQNLSMFMQDKRIMDALGVIMNIDLSAHSTMPTEDDPLTHKPGEGPSVTELTGEDSEGEGKGVEPMETGAGPKVEESAEVTTNQKEALEAKERGNAAYKQRDFATALACYDQASQLDPTNLSFLTNKAAVYFEQGSWEQCLHACQEAVDRGREVRADFKVIAKTLARMGNVYLKQGDYENAIKFFDKSLADHRNPDIVSKSIEAKKKLKEQDRLAYIDPDKSTEEKEKGNKSFKDGKFPDAIKFYTEAIKRNPDDPKLHSNRAACYQKLLEFNLALKDCDTCVKLDPSFVKGHIRRGHALMALRDTVRAMQAFQEALDLDPHNADAKAGLQRCYVQDNPEERRKRAMQDPEVQSILGDPAMQLVLQQMKDNPAALRDHLNNPEVASKIQKLIECGFIGVH